MSDENFAPPDADAIPGGIDDDDDIGEIRVPFILPLAAFIGLVSALFTMSAGAQGLVFLQYPAWSLLKYVPYVFVASGLLGLVVAGQVYTGRLWGTVAAAVVLGFNAMCGGLWSVFDLWSGLFVPLPLLAAMLAVLATLLVGLAVPAAARLSAQRKRLYSP